MNHADPIDRAAAQMEQQREAAIKSYRKPEGPAETGFCLSCEEPIEKGRWCDADCRDDWERDQTRAA